MEIEEKTLVMELSGPVELNDAQLDAVAAGALVSAKVNNVARVNKLDNEVIATVS